MKLHYKISGEGTPLIILHGLFGTLDNWGSQAATLGQSFQVISVDLRNHGQSPHHKDMNYSVMAEDVIELMNNLNIDKAHIIGHSMGGKVAMQLAINNVERVDKLIIVDISPVAYPVHHQQIIEGLLSIDLETLKSRADADQQLTQYESDLGIRAFLLKNLYRNEHKKFAWRANINVIKTQYNNISNAPTNTANTKFYGPTLFIKGNNSDYIQMSHTSAIQELFENISFKLIEGAGHWPHAEKPKIFSSIIIKFLNK